MYYKFTLQAKSGTKVAFRVYSDLTYYDDSKNLSFYAIEFDTPAHSSNFFAHQNLKDYLQAHYSVAETDIATYISNLKESTSAPAQSKRYIWTNHGYFLDAFAYFRDHAFSVFTAIECKENGETIQKIENPNQLFNQVVAKFRQHKVECPDNHFKYIRSREIPSLETPVSDGSAAVPILSKLLTSEPDPAKPAASPLPLSHPNPGAGLGLSSGWKWALFILLGIVLILGVAAITWGSMGLLTAPAALAVTNFIVSAFGATLATIPQATFIATLATSVALVLGAAIGIFLVAKQPTKEVLSGPSSASLTYSKLSSPENGSGKEEEAAPDRSLFTGYPGNNNAASPSLPVSASHEPAATTSVQP